MTAISVLFILKIVISIIILSVLLSFRKVYNGTISTAIGIETVELVLNIVGTGLSYSHLRPGYNIAITWTLLIFDVGLVFSLLSVYMVDKRSIWILPILLVFLDISLGSLLIYKLMTKDTMYNTQSISRPETINTPSRTETINTQSVLPSPAKNKPENNITRSAPIVLPKRTVNPTSKQMIEDELRSLRAMVDKAIDKISTDVENNA